jgi:hypothetical protein
MRPRDFSFASNHPKAWTLTDELKPEDIDRLRAVLKPRRERYGFAYTMNRWAKLASDTGTVVRVNLFDPPSKWPADDGADLVAELLGGKLPPLRKKGQEPPSSKRGRRPLDRERYAALLLGHIFQEYAEAQPTRVWDAIEDREVSPFYRFATAAFEAIGLKRSDEVFRDVCGAWENPTKHIEFNSQAIKDLLWGGLSPRD